MSRLVRPVPLGDSPTRVRISLFTSSYLSAVVVGRLKNACWDLPVRRGASARAQSSGSHPSVVAVFSNICKYAFTSSLASFLAGAGWLVPVDPVTERAGGRPCTGLQFPGQPGPGGWPGVLRSSAGAG